MKESEAQAKCEEIIAGRIEVFCPLKKGICNTRCEAFVKPTVFNRSKFNDIDSYAYAGGYCEASALHGRMV